MEGRAQELSTLCHHPWGTGLSCCEPGRDRDLRHDLRGEWHPLLALETRPGSPGAQTTPLKLDQKPYDKGNFVCSVYHHVLKT